MRGNLGGRFSDVKETLEHGLGNLVSVQLDCVLELGSKVDRVSLDLVETEQHFVGQVLRRHLRGRIKVDELLMFNLLDNFLGILFDVGLNLLE